jgi:hypothetical protein
MPSPQDATADDAFRRTTKDPRDFWSKTPRPVLKSRVAGGKGESWVDPRSSPLPAPHGTVSEEPVGRIRKNLRATWLAEAETLGPGYYGTDLNKVPYASKRIITSIGAPGARMQPENKDVFNSPGSGTYGLGGVPHARYERTLDRSQPKYSSPTKKGVMANEGRKWGPVQVDGVAPGQYHTEPAVLKDATGTRGPYELMTGERFDLRKKGKKGEDSLGPGQYTLKPVAPVCPNREHLIFSKDAPRFSTVAGDRHTNSTLAQYPRNPEQPKPGQYYSEAQYSTLKKAPRVGKHAPFGRSADRTDQRGCYKTDTFNGDMFATNGHSIAPNQYARGRDWKSGRDGAGGAGVRSSGTNKYMHTHRSAVQSTTTRFV